MTKWHCSSFTILKRVNILGGFEKWVNRFEKVLLWTIVWGVPRVKWMKCFRVICILFAYIM